MVRSSRFVAAGLATLILLVASPLGLSGSDSARFLPIGITNTCAGACDCGVWGDVDGEGLVAPTDVANMANLIYRNLDAIVQPPDCPLAAGDADCSGQITPLDMVLYVNLVYRGNSNGWCGNLCGPGGSLVGTSSCKSFQMSKIAAYTPNDDCIEYTYDGLNTLRLTHVNAGFNCCPDPILAEISIEPGHITIDEDEGMELGGCDCLCLFDIEYEIVNLPPGVYTIRINGLYYNETDEPLEFTVDLAANLTGEHCVFRDHYPWGD